MNQGGIQTQYTKSIDKYDVPFHRPATPSLSVSQVSHYYAQNNHTMQQQ